MQNSGGISKVITQVDTLYRMEVTYMSNNLIDTKQDIVFYNDEDGNFNVEVLVKDEDVWLNTKGYLNYLK